MWTQNIMLFQTALSDIERSLAQCPAWPVIADPLFITVFLIILSALACRRAYKAMVALVSGLAFIMICQSTLINVVIPGNFGNKLFVFVVGFLAVSVVNVYFFLVRD